MNPISENSPPQVQIDYLKELIDRIHEEMDEMRNKFYNEIANLKTELDKKVDKPA